MRNKDELSLKIRKIWTKIQKTLIYIIVILFIVLIILNNIISIENDQISNYLFYFLVGIFFFVVIISSFIPTYPNEEEIKFQIKKTSILIIDSKLDLKFKRHGKFKKIRENFEIIHIPWESLTEVVISDFQIVILTINSEILVSWDFNQEITHFKKEFSSVLEKNGTIIVFAGFCTISNRINPVFSTIPEKFKVNISTFLPFIVTKENTNRVTSYLEFNDNIPDIFRKLFFQEGKINSQWFWVLDKESYTGYCKELAYNNQGEVVSGLFYEQETKGSVIVLPHSFTIYSNIKKILDNLRPLFNSIKHIKETGNLEISSEKIPKWVSEYDILNGNEIKEIIKEKKEELKAIEERKKLLYTTDKELEKSVQMVLEIFGYHNFKKTKEKVDLIFDDEDIRFVAEIKGLTRTAKPRDVRQLYVWMKNEEQDIDFENRRLKGLFICNTERNIKPEERKNPFDKNLIKESEKLDWGLLTTQELLKTYEQQSKGKISNEEIRRRLSSESGEIILSKN